MSAPTDPWLVAAATLAGPVSTVGARFMSHPRLATVGEALGYESNDFYYAGRAGVLGDVSADAVTRAFVFFSPEMVQRAWERSAPVQFRRAAATAFARVGAFVAESMPEGGVDWAGLGRSATAVVEASPLRTAPLVREWLRHPLPTLPRAAASQQLNVLRELRMAVHASAIDAFGVTVSDAVRHRSAPIAHLFGWERCPVDADVVERWTRAEASTDAAMADALRVLDRSELDRMVESALGAAACWT